MISRRQYISIVMIFLTVFLLFQGTQAGKLYLDSLSVNTVSGETGFRRSSARSGEGRILKEDDMPAGSGELLFVGDEESPCAKMLTEWAAYADRTIRFRDALPAIGDGVLPYLIMIGPEDAREQAELLTAYTRKGSDILVTDLPDPAAAASGEAFLKLLGISRIVSPETELSGIRLFPGFLLGGERIFRADDEREPMDLPLHFPWYCVQGGTKTYIQGMLPKEQQEAEEIRNEELPALLWRNHIQNGEVYVVPGEWLSDRKTGMGILEAVMYERSSYRLYPVINAQLLSVLNFPMTAQGNEEAFRERYGSSLVRFEENAVVPEFIALSVTDGFRPGFFLNTGTETEDENAYREGFLKYHLMMLREMKGELGVSLMTTDREELREALFHEEEFLRKEDVSYEIRTAAGDMDEALLSGSGEPFRLRSAALLPDPDYPLIGYLSEDLTCQQITLDGSVRHSFSDELSLLSLETALGYAHTGIDMQKVFWPESPELEWQLSSRELFGSLRTHQEPFSYFDRVTLSEGDARLRSFLSLRFRSERQENVIRLHTEGGAGESWFLLRTHGEELRSMTGGTFEKAEEGTWLICAEEPEVTLTLGSGMEDLFRKKGGT